MRRRYRNFLKKMNSKFNYSKVEANILEGQKEKATLRLKSMINNNPDDLEIREKLAQLYYDSGFYDSAGKYWILKDSEKEHIRKCVEIYIASVKNSGHHILMDIKFSGEKSLLPLYSQEVLNKLEEDSFAKTKYIPTFARRIKTKVET